MNLLKGSVFLKLAAFVVAVFTYFYIQHEVENTDKKNSSDASYKLIKLTAKKLSVRVRIGDDPPDGYRVPEEQVQAVPSQITVIGPEALLEEALDAETSIIDVSEYTKSITKQVPIESVAGIHLTGAPYLVDVAIPIEKIPEPAGAAPAEEVAPTDTTAPPAAA